MGISEVRERISSMSLEEVNAEISNQNWSKQFTMNLLLEQKQKLIKIIDGI